tara:strand:- start:2107 stop:2517 length:411 start_codon:yes stop_codon:yes gene_type:complete
MENLTIRQKLEIKKLRDKNLTKVVVSYSGGGDDGCIDDYHSYTMDEKGDEKFTSVDLKSFSDAFEDYIYELLHNTVQWDWVNNSGGYGQLTIDLDNQSVYVDHNQNTVEEYYYDDEKSEGLKEISKAISNGTSIIA